MATVTPDRFVNKGPGRPVFNQRLRTESVAALGSVTYAAVTESPSAEDVIRLLRPAVYVKGSEYADVKDDLTGKIVDERRAVEESGGRVHFTTEITFSSSSLLTLHFASIGRGQEFLREVRQRHSGEDVSASAGSQAPQVLVIGETIIESTMCSDAKSPRGVSTTVSGGGRSRGILASANHGGLCGQVEV